MHIVSVHLSLNFIFICYNYHFKISHSNRFVCASSPNICAKIFGHIDRMKTAFRQYVLSNAVLELASMKIACHILYNEMVFHRYAFSCVSSDWFDLCTSSSTGHKRTAFHLCARSIYVVSPRNCLKISFRIHHKSVFCWSALVCALAGLCCVYIFDHTDRKRKPSLLCALVCAALIEFYLRISDHIGHMRMVYRPYGHGTNVALNLLFVRIFVCIYRIRNAIFFVLVISHGFALTHFLAALDSMKIRLLLHCFPPAPLSGVILDPYSWHLLH